MPLNQVYLPKKDYALPDLDLLTLIYSKYYGTRKIVSLGYRTVHGATNTVSR